MSDIIQDAKQLLDAATPGPWEWVGYDIEQVSSAGSATVLEFQCVTEFGMVGALRNTEVTPEDEQLIAAAPELAQTLAEETWEYSFQIKHSDGWETARNDVTYLEEWWPEKINAEDAANSVYDPYLERPMPLVRLVRRRVSLPEVVE